MPEAPLILIVEDEYPLQGVVEEALADGGFASHILSSGEEALTLFKGGTKCAMPSGRRHRFVEEDGKSGHYSG